MENKEIPPACIGSLCKFFAMFYFLLIGLITTSWWSGGNLAGLIFAVAWEATAC